ncbi:DDE-type integrase/transposase/recombinase [Clostridium sp. D2Q-14]|nr:DDE-type integrase/transposase/recombinase [Anaeromonas gelatinilytica]
MTYVNVRGKRNYICILLDLYNREIIGYTAGKNKDANLVYKTFSTIKRSLEDVNILHTDRGNKLKNKIIDDLLTTFEITRSLSKKICPYGCEAYL